MPDIDEMPESDADALFGVAVRARRAQLGITLDQLAQSSGVSPGALSRVERGLLSPSLRNAMAIAHGLGCELGELLQPGAQAEVTRKGEHQRYLHEDSGVERMALARPVPGIEWVEYRLPPGAQSSHFAPHRSGTREVFQLLDGTVRIWTGAHSVQLRSGDTAVLTMDVEHRFINEGRKPARLMLLVVAPSP